MSSTPHPADAGEPNPAVAGDEAANATGRKQKQVPNQALSQTMCENVAAFKKGDPHILTTRRSLKTVATNTKELKDKTGDPNATVVEKPKQEVMQDMDELKCATILEDKERGEGASCGKTQEQAPVGTEMSESPAVAESPTVVGIEESQSPAVAEIEESQARAAVVTTSSWPGSTSSRKSSTLAETPHAPMPKRSPPSNNPVVPPLPLTEINTSPIAFGEFSPSTPPNPLTSHIPLRSPSTESERALSTMSGSTYNDTPRDALLVFNSRGDEPREPASPTKSGSGNIGVYLCNFGSRSLEGSNSDGAYAAEVRRMMDNSLNKMLDK